MRPDIMLLPSPYPCYTQRMSEIVDSVILTGGNTSLTVNEAGVRVTGVSPTNPEEEITKPLDVNGGLSVKGSINTHGHNVVYGAGHSIHTYTDREDNPSVTVQTYMSGREFKVHRWTGSGSATTSNIIIQLDNDKETSDTFLNIKSPNLNHSVKVVSGNTGADILVDNVSIVPEDTTLTAGHIAGTTKLKNKGVYKYTAGTTFDMSALSFGTIAGELASARLIIDTGATVPTTQTWGTGKFVWIANAAADQPSALTANTRHHFAMEYNKSTGTIAINLAYTLPLA